MRHLFERLRGAGPSSFQWMCRTQTVWCAGALCSGVVSRRNKQNKTKQKQTNKQKRRRKKKKKEKKKRDRNTTEDNLSDSELRSVLVLLPYIFLSVCLNLCLSVSVSLYPSVSVSVIIWMSSTLASNNQFNRMVWISIIHHPTNQNWYI